MKDKSNFYDLIKGDIPVLVDFYTDWCSPCKTMNPILQDLKTKMGDKLNIIKVNAETNADVTIRFQVRGVPTLILFHKGNILWQKAGVFEAKHLEMIINQQVGYV